MLIGVITGIYSSVFSRSYPVGFGKWQKKKKLAEGEKVNPGSKA
jgi:hypothetical protein